MGQVQAPARAAMETEKQHVAVDTRRGESVVDWMLGMLLSLANVPFHQLLRHPLPHVRTLGHSTPARDAAWCATPRPSGLLNEGPS